MTELPETLPLLRFGRQGPYLHFSHANGFPPEAYRPLLSALGASLRVLASPLRPLWPDADPQSITDWSPLAADLIALLEKQGLGPLIGCGHSVGATATLIAALQRPDLFRALVLIDPVLMPHWLGHVWRLATRLGFARRLHPLLSATPRRRRVFESREQMFTLYRRKRVFARLSDEALEAYVAAIAAPRPEGGVVLRYSPEWEERIYLTGILRDPTTWRELSALQLPVLLLRATETDAFYPQAAAAFLRRVPHAELQVVPDSSHLLPLERPQ
ncbi:MAG: alpha/beta hydrolase, partial [Anaerolineae bacterium]